MQIKSSLFLYFLSFLAICSGYFTYLGFAPYDKSLALYQGLFFYAFLLSVRPCTRKWKFLLPFLWDWSFSFSTLYWLNDTVNFYGDFPIYLSNALVFTVTAIIACRSLLVAFIWALINPRCYIRYFILLPVVFSISTYVYYECIINFGWLNFGYASIDQISKFFAPLGGVYLVQFVKFSFAVAALSLLYYLFVRSSKAVTYDRAEQSTRARTSLYPNNGNDLGNLSPLRTLSSDSLASNSVFAGGTNSAKVVGKFKARRFIDWIAFSTIVAAGGYALYNPVPLYTKAVSDPIKVALIQPNLDPHGKWDRSTIQSQIELYRNFIQKGIAEYQPSYFVMPESSIGAEYRQLKDVFTYYGNLAGKGNAEIITGITNTPHVSAFLYTSKDLANRYYADPTLASSPAHIPSQVSAEANKIQEFHKKHLVPFGEYLPFASLLANMHPFFSTLNSYGLQRGEVVQPTLKGLRSNFSLAICYDTLFGQELAEEIKYNADRNTNTEVIASISNDVWFGNTEGPYQHFNIVRFRALENQRYVLRDANNGITAIVDPLGQVTAELPRNQEGILYGTYRNYEGLTPYQADSSINYKLLAFLLGAIFLGTLILNTIIGKRKRGFNFKKL